MHFKLISLTLTFLFFSIDSLFCQNAIFGVTGNIGLSKIHHDIESEGSNKDNLVLSGNLGVLLEKNKKPSFGFGVKLLWVSLKGEKEISDLELYTINPETLMREVVGSRTTSTSFQSNYIGVPIYYFHNLGKLKINAGIQSMFLLNTKSRYKDDILFNGEASQNEGENTNFQFNKLDLGITSGISYGLTNKLHLAGSFYYGLLNVNKQSGKSKRKNRQFTLGLNYYLHSF